MMYLTKLSFQLKRRGKCSWVVLELFMYQYVYVRQTAIPKKEGADFYYKFL